MAKLIYSKNKQRDTTYVIEPIDRYDRTLPKLSWCGQLI